MKQSYDDILELFDRSTTEGPKWWDECGVPRFCEPHPSRVNSIYAQEVCFFNIGCQACGHRFLVAAVQSFLNDGSLERKLMDHGLHYGDPPNTGCCATGPTMNSDPLTVESFWRRDNKTMQWEKIAKLSGHQIKDL